MKSKYCQVTCACLLAGSLNGLAENVRYVTLEVAATRSFQQLMVATNEVAELTTVLGHGFRLELQRGNLYYPILADNTSAGVAKNPAIMTVGPASFNFQQYYTGQDGSALATFRITPVVESTPPNKTLVVEPNQGNVAITMESTTNLVEWSTVTNGIYNTTNTATFYRVRMDKGQ